MDRYNQFEVLEQDKVANQCKPLKSDFLYGKEFSVRQISNRFEFFRLLNSQQVSDNI
jgi:hypothetical protein